MMRTDNQEDRLMQNLDLMRMPLKPQSYMDKVLTADKLNFNYSNQEIVDIMVINEAIEVAQLGKVYYMGETSDKMAQSVTNESYFLNIFQL